MTTLDYSIEIDKPLTDVYALASQVERQPEFMPDYLSCKVIDRQPERMLLERSAKIHGKVNVWQSWVRFRPDEGVYFTHEGGRLHGMQVNWRFQPDGPDRTRMTLSQTFNVRHPIPGVGAVLERWVFAPKLSDIARRVIRSFKTLCEGDRP